MAMHTSRSATTNNRFWRYLTVALAAFAGAPAVCAARPDTFARNAGEPRSGQRLRGPTVLAFELSEPHRHGQALATHHAYMALAELSADAAVTALAYPELAEIEALSADAHVSALARGRLGRG